MTDKENLYTGNEYLKYNPSWHLEDSPWKARKIIKIIPKEILHELSSPIKIVDIGCGAGEILKLVCKFFKANDFSVIAEGYDISPSAIKIANKNFPEGNFHCQASDRLEHKNTGQNIDFILLIDILEHIKNPEKLLADISKTSKYVICHLPLEDNFEVKIRGLKKRFKKTTGHIHYYNKKSAIELFQKNGLGIKNMEFTCLDYDADYIMKSLPRRLIAQPLRKFFFKNHPEFTAKVLGNCSIMFFLRPLKK